MSLQTYMSQVPWARREQSAILTMLRSPPRRHQPSWNNGTMPIQIAMTIGSISFRCRSDAKASNRCLIDVEPMVFWACIDMAMLTCGMNWHNKTRGPVSADNVYSTSLLVKEIKIFHKKKLYDPYIMVITRGCNLQRPIILFYQWCQPKF